ncbi:MAG: hypothetical protein NWR72_06285 [Bacteroidia bacterium]|nr:hypothetical protein [Bacteroidia bacterium]
MKVSPFLALLFALPLLLTACLQQDLPLPDGCEEARVNDSSYPPNRQDAFTLNSASITGNELSANVSYGGGCNANGIDFDAWGEELPTAGPLPVYQLHLTLRDDDNCEAFLTRDFCFDLSTLNKPSATTATLRVLGPSDTLVLSW